MTNNENEVSASRDIIKTSVNKTGLMIRANDESANFPC